MNTRPRLLPSFVGIVAGYYVHLGIYHMMLTGSCSTPAALGETPCPPGTGKYFAYVFVGILVAMGSIFAGGSWLAFGAIFAGVGAGAIRAGLAENAPDGSGWYWWFGGIFLLTPLTMLVSLPFVGLKRLRATRLLSQGQEAIGTVLSIEDTGVTVNQNPRVRMRFRIEPNDGITPPWEAVKTATVSRVQLPRVGDRYPVWFDPSNRDQWMFARDDALEALKAQPSLRKIVELAKQGARPGIPGPPPDTVVQELNRLNELHLTGKITPEEFASRTAALLRGTPA